MLSEHALPDRAALDPLLGGALEPKPGALTARQAPDAHRRGLVVVTLLVGAWASLLFLSDPTSGHSAVLPSSLFQAWAPAKRSQDQGRLGVHRPTVAQWSLEPRARAPMHGFSTFGAVAQDLEAPATEIKVDSTEAPATEIKADSTKLWDQADEDRVTEWSAKHFTKISASASEFPIKPEDLIMKAKIFLAYDMGVSKPDLLADGFEFVGPVVGPLSKETYLRAVGGFELGDAFPDMNNEMHHFRVDPYEPSRVWFTARGRGTNTGDAPGNPLFGKATGKQYINPPQACSIRFNLDGKVNQYTIGAVMDRRIGNTGGLGGVYGIAYAMGKPLPFREAQPWKPSFRYRLFQKIGELVRKRSES